MNKHCTWHLKIFKPQIWHLYKGKAYLRVAQNQACVGAMVLIKEGAYLSEYGYIPEIKMKKILFTVM